MTAAAFAFVFLACLCQCFGSVSVPSNGPEAGWVKDLIYTTFVAHPCVTLSERSGPIGCTTPPDGTSAILYRASNPQELEAALSAADSFDGSPAAVFLAPELLSVATVQRLQNASGVAGVIIAQTNAVPPAFSLADKYPNRQFGLHPDSKHVWNTDGGELLWTYMRKPWFALSVNDTRSFDAAITKAEEAGRKAGVLFTLQMQDKTDTTTCLRRGWCDPLGGVSVISSFTDKENCYCFNVIFLKTFILSQDSIKNSSEVVLVMASLDSSSLFHTRAPGAVSDISGTVALLGAFRGLVATYGKNLNEIAQRPAVFHWFSSEAWGFGGSKLYARLVASGKAPYNLSSIYGILEAKQVGTRGAKLFVHQEPNADNAPLVESLTSGAQDAGVSPLTFVPADPFVGIPPSSTMAYLLSRPQARAAVVTDHGTSYANKFYHSVFDDFNNVDPQLVCDAAKVLGNTVARLMKISGPFKAVDVNCTFLTEVLSCLTKDWRCPLMQQYIPVMANADMYPTSYVGVFQGKDVMPPPTKLIHDLLIEVTSTVANPAECSPSNKCPSQGNEFFCVRGRCLDAKRTFYEIAITPAFTNFGSQNDTTLPVFTESRWKTVGMQLFVIVTPVSQIITVVSGVVITIVAAVACFFGAKVFTRDWELA